MADLPEDSPFWHYDWLRTENYLNPRDIEKQGTFLLHRGLNTGRLIAFLGSGVSAAYGRVTWGELGLAVLQGLDVALAELKKLASKRPQFGDEQLAELGDRVVSLRKQVAAGQGEEITLAMHLAERMFIHAAEYAAKVKTSDSTALDVLANAFGAKPSGSDDARKHEHGRDLFRRIVREETYDEFAYIRRLLSSAWRVAGQKRADGADRTGTLHDDEVDALALARVDRPLDRFRHQASLEQVRFEAQLFRPNAGGVSKAARELTGRVRQLLSDRGDALGVHAQLLRLACNLADQLTSLLEEKAAKIEPPTGSLQPNSWPAVALLLDVLRFLNGHPATHSNVMEEIAQSLGKTRITAAELRARQSGDQGHGPSERARMIPHDHDPLWQLAFDLGVPRFATLNFDLEIERLLQDALYRQTSYPDQPHLSGSEIERFGPLGGRARDFVLGEKTIAEFIDFASGEGPYEFQVVHLHGRATDGDDLVLTERDYQKSYVGDDSVHEAMSAGFELMFGGNPVLFVGIGLSEGDVLRPLREFAAGRTRRNRAIIALRDGSDKSSEQDCFTLQQYIRYGAYILHYGMRTGDGYDKNKPAEFWLHHLAEYCDALKDVAQDLEQKHEPRLDHLKKRRDLLFTQLPGPEAEFESDGSRCDIRFELRLLDAIEKFCRECVGVQDDRCGPLLTIAIPRTIERALSAAKTAALNCKLQSVKREWTEWWRDWRNPPQARPVVVPLHEVVGSLRPRADEADLEPLYATRHIRHVVVEPPEHQNPLDESDDPQDPNPSPGLREFLLSVPPLDKSSGRRVFALSAPRGAGKGSMFTELTRHADWILQSQPRPSWKHQPASRYAGYYMAGLSFSPEAASVWDNLINFLGMTPENGEIARQQIPADASGSQQQEGRIAQLRRALAQLPQKIGAVRDHLHGLTKETIVPRYLIVFNGFDLLFSPAGYPKNAEIRAICDILFNEADDAPLDIIVLFRDTVIPLYFRHPEAPTDIPSHRALCRGRVVQLLLSPIDSSPEYGIERQAYIAEVLARGAVDVRLSAHEVFHATPESVARREKGNLLPLDVGRYFRVLHRCYVEDLGFIKSKVLGELSRFLETRSATATVRNVERLLRTHLGNSRYRFSIVLAIFEDALAPNGTLSEMDPGQRVVFDNFLDAIGRGSGIQSEGSGDHLFTEAIDYWSHRAPRAKMETAAVDQLETACGPGKSSREDPFPQVIISAADPVLQEELLRHLAVIAVPVAADVLARAPRVRDACLTALAKNAPDRSKEIEAVQQIDTVRAGLCILWKRGFALLTQPERFVDGNIEPRFTVHRSLQRHVYRKLGSQEVEPADAFAFAISVYAAQTRQLPSLSANAYAFLNQLMDELIGYPSRSTPSPQGHVVLARALRAALGVAQTLYSLAVVARFADLPGLGRPDPPNIGYFEHHRLALRWMLDQAKRHDTEAHHRPFYRDDIVWLYNECGVFSLAQGQLHDAGALFFMATRAARQIEGAVGPIGRRIRLNSAVTALERGRFAQARRELSDVLAVPEEDETVRMIATGYMGLLYHLSGETNVAKERYDQAIERLEFLKRPRPVSIFLRHRGTLHRHLGQEEDARKDLVRAFATAGAAGMQDLLWLAQVELAALDIHDPEKRRRSADIIRRLEDADRYADTMDVPRLTSHIMAVRAVLLLIQGETSRAGQLVTRALRLATLNGMTLRSINYRLLLARIRKARDRVDEADRIRDQALTAAMQIGYRLKVGMRNP